MVKLPVAYLNITETRLKYKPNHGEWIVFIKHRPKNVQDFLVYDAFVLSQVLRDVLPRHAIRKRGLCCRPMSVRPSVCLSVAFVYFNQTAENIANLLS